MSTRSKTTVYNEDNKPILSIYRQMDGFFEGMGKDLQEFLKDMHICNGISNEQSNGKWSNGMSCLAAQLVAHFKNGIGGIYITDHECEQEYNYDITYVKDGKVKLVGWFDDGDKKNFPLYEDEMSDFIAIMEFIYPTKDYVDLQRKIGVTELDEHYIKGFDLLDGNKFKCFRRSKIKKMNNNS